MAGRPKHYEEEELIDKAIEVFWEKGYNAASAQDLLKAMNIGQGSFYRSFAGGKRELYHKSLHRFLEKAIQQFYVGLEQSQDPIQFIKDFFYLLADRSKEEIGNGCYFGNAIVELSRLDEGTKSLSAQLLTKLTLGFEKAISKAQTEGKLDKTKSAKTIALHLINLWNGINVTLRMYSDRQEMLALLELNLKILDE